MVLPHQLWCCRHIFKMFVFSMLTSVIMQAQLSNSFYIPGVAPTEYKAKEKLDIRAVKMTSVKTQLPYDYYALPFCKPSDSKLHYKPENLGEILRGDRIVNTPYEMLVHESIQCRVVCGGGTTPLKLSKQESNMFINMIKEDYTLHMLIDNLPAATAFKNINTKELQYEDGFKLGFVVEGKVFLNNHLDMTIRYHPVTSTADDEELYRIVGFEVVPRSFAASSLKATEAKTCTLSDYKVEVLQLVPDSENEVIFSYSVSWEPSNVAWASRWDTYLHMSDVEIHWFAICNSVAIVLFLSGILALIIVRTLRRDIARYNRDEEFDDALEETGWKLVHGDVFRPPQYPMLLVACIGSGLQLFCMVLVIIVFAMFGMLSPASRGALMTAAIVFFMFMGILGGYHAARLYKTLKGTNWKQAAAMTAGLYPGILFGTGFFLNFFIWGAHSSGAVPFTTMIALLCLWFGISVPLIFIGFYFGFRKQPYDHPVRTNQIPRQIPDQVWYLSPFISTLIAGILPFGAVFVELFFILTAIWENQFYYLFGFLFLVFVILIIACSEVTIVMVYFQLCSEDYHWWWRSMFLSGACSYYVFAYSVVYYYTKLEINEFIPTILYFGYTIIMVIGFWLLTATIGFYSTYTFIRQIYAAVKQD
ncbi:transmembrane 9 superfamily member 4-like [Dysidea avara]|uniref:transmembrane 9 superfamily member 4-like n=1 Tax=Dysidea avara TaxID=196820 RepID=UPI0033293E75